MTAAFFGRCHALARQGLAGQAGALMLGTLVAQVTTFAVTPILTRLYGAENFGEFGLYVACAAVLGSIAAWRLEAAISIPESELEAARLALLAILVASLTCALGWLVLYALRTIPFLVGVNWLAHSWVYVVPAAALVVCANQISAQLNLRESRFQFQAAIRAGQSMMSAAVSVTLGLIGIVTWGLIAGTLAAQALTCAVQYRGSRAKNLEGITSELLPLLVRYKKFPMYQVPSTLVETVTSYLPVLVFASAFGTKSAGLFFLAQIVVRVPVTFISNAVGEVFRQRASRQYAAQGECGALVRLTAKQLALIAVPAFSALALVGPMVFSVVFGAPWGESGTYARLLAPMCAAQFIASPLSNIFLVAQRQGSDLVIQILTTILVIIALAVGALVYKDPIIALGLYSAAYVIRYGVQIWLAFKIGKA